MSFQSHDRLLEQAKFIIDFTQLEWKASWYEKQAERDAAQKALYAKAETRWKEDMRKRSACKKHYSDFPSCLRQEKADFMNSEVRNDNLNGPESEVDICAINTNCQTDGTVHAEDVLLEGAVSSQPLLNMEESNVGESNSFQREFDRSNPSMDEDTVDKASKVAENIPEQQHNEEVSESSVLEKGRKSKRKRNRNELSRRQSLAAFSTRTTPLKCKETRETVGAVRRSTRVRSRPLEFWKGERFLYGCVEGNGSNPTVDEGTVDKASKVAENIPEQHNEEFPESSGLEKDKTSKAKQTRNELSQRQSLAALSIRTTPLKSKEAKETVVAVRRSTRIRSRPLEFWKGERFLYGCIDGSLSTVIGIKYVPSSGECAKLNVKSYVSKEYQDLVEKAAALY